MLAQASTGLIETWWVSRLGTDALAGMALVFPGFMMMQMLSAGAMGGGISSAIARALGAGRRDDADALVLHALLINGGLGVVTSVVLLAFGRPIYAAMGGEGGSLEAALAYSNVVFAGNVAGLAHERARERHPRHRQHARAVARRLRRRRRCWCRSRRSSSSARPGPGARHRRRRASRSSLTTRADRGGARLVRPRPAAASSKLRRGALRALFFADILRVGAVGAISTLQTTLTVALTTALVGVAGGTDAVAGYGTGARLEYLLIPLVFGLGAPLVALVGTNIGAGQRERALRIALTGGALAFAHDRGDRPRRRDLAAGLARPVRRRPAHARDRRRLPARRRPGVRLLRPWPVRSTSPRRAPASSLWPLIARHAAPAHRRRRRLARRCSLTGSLAWAFAALALGARRLRRDDRQRDRIGKLVQTLIGGASTAAFNGSPAPA